MALVSSTRYALLAIVAVAILAFAGELALLGRNKAGERYYTTQDRAVTTMVDKLEITDSADAFRAGDMNDVVLAPDARPARIILEPKRQKAFPRSGTWTTKQVATDFPFTELLPSWNAFTPPETGVLFHVRSRDLASGEWSPWLRIGSWGRVNDKGSVGRFALGYIDDDTLKLNRPADAYQFRATFQSFHLAPEPAPSIRRMTITYSGPADKSSVWAKNLAPAPLATEQWARDLQVPFRAQGNNDYSVTHMTCSPTSISMVLHYFGVDRPTMENCLAVWDDHNEMFGNWSNNTQRAGELGMDAWLQRFRNWDQVKALIAQGQPVVASIKFDKGTYEDHPYDQSTGGHLIVIRGFMPDGTVIVNDPGSKAHGNRALWPARGLGHAWFGHGGVGYVIRPPATPIPGTLVKSLPTTMPATAPVAATR